MVGNDIIIIALAALHSHSILLHILIVGYTCILYEKPKTENLSIDLCVCVCATFNQVIVRRFIRLSHRIAVYRFGIEVYSPYAFHQSVDNTYKSNPNRHNFFQQRLANIIIIILRVFFLDRRNVQLTDLHRITSTNTLVVIFNYPEGALSFQQISWKK